MREKNYFSNWKNVAKKRIRFRSRKKIRNIFHLGLSISMFPKNDLNLLRCRKFYKIRNNKVDVKANVAKYYLLIRNWLKLFSNFFFYLLERHKNEWMAFLKNWIEERKCVIKRDEILIFILWITASLKEGSCPLWTPWLSIITPSTSAIHFLVYKNSWIMNSTIRKSYISLMKKPIKLKNISFNKLFKKSINLK